MRKCLCLLVILPLFGGCANKQAEEPEKDFQRGLMVTNARRAALVRLSAIAPDIAPEKASLLGQYEAIRPRVTMYVSLASVTKACIVDLKAEFDDGSSVTVTDRDICRGTMEVVFDRTS